MLKSLCCKERNNLLNIKTPGMQSLHLLIKLKIMKKNSAYFKQIL